MNILTLHVDPTLPRYGTDLIQAHRKIQTASPHALSTISLTNAKGPCYTSTNV